MQKNTKRFLVLSAMLAVAFVVSGCKQAAAPTSNTNAVVPSANTNTTPPATEGGETKTFAVKGSNFAFDVKEIKVKKGDTVAIEFENVEGFHDWVIDDFVARTKQLQAGEKETIQFVADKTGTFEYYCSVGQHRKFGMVGKLIVE